MKKYFIYGVLFLSIVGFKAAYGQAQFSLLSDKSDATNIKGAELTGDVYIFTAAEHNLELTLRWNPNADKVDGYYVYSHKPPRDSIPVVVNKLATVLHDINTFDENGFPFYNTLVTEIPNWIMDSSMCFRLKAWRETATSDSGYSEAVCTMNSSISEVVFYIDDIDLSGAPFSTEKVIPYDLLGEDATGLPIAFDTSSLTAGDHTLTVVTNFTDGETSGKQTVAFTTVKKPLAIPTTPSISKKVIMN